MKKLVMIVAIAILIITTSFGQEITLSPQASKGYDVTTGVSTEQTVDVEGKSYEVFRSPKGSEYIISQGTKGQFPVWIGTPSTYTLNGKAIRLSKSGKAVILYLKNGNARCRYVSFASNDTSG